MHKMSPLTDGVAAYAGGKRHETERSTGITDLTSGDAFRTAAVTDEATAEAAVTSAAAAAVDETTVQQRAAWCSAIAAGLRERRSELADSLVREAGKPSTSARAEVDHAAERFEYVVAELRELSGEYRTWTAANRTEWNALVKVAPLGVVVCRPDAESPLGSAVLQVAPALAAGNSVVLQPAKATPVAASVLTHIIASTDVPAAGFAFVPEPTSVASKALSTHDDVAAIVQSDPSRAVGRTETADGTVRLRMALDDTAPAVVLGDVDVADAAEAVTTGRLKHPGHRTPGTGSVAVHETVSDALVTRLDAHMEEWQAGDLSEESTSVAPLVDQSRATRVDEPVIDAVDRGATVVRGGGRDGRAYEPTLLTDVPPGSSIERPARHPASSPTATTARWRLRTRSASGRSESTARPSAAPTAASSAPREQMATVSARPSRVSPAENASSTDDSHSHTEPGGRPDGRSRQRTHRRRDPRAKRPFRRWREGNQRLEVSHRDGRQNRGDRTARRVSR